jgi:hypothetical protein
LRPFRGDGLSTETCSVVTEKKILRFGRYLGKPGFMLPLRRVQTVMTFVGIEIDTAVTYILGSHVMTFGDSPNTSP